VPSTEFEDLILAAVRLAT